MIYLLFVLGGLVIGGLGVLVFRSARALNKRIEEHFADEERQTKDPYAQMAEILSADTTSRRQKTKRRQG